VHSRLHVFGDLPPAKDASRLHEHRPLHGHVMRHLGMVGKLFAPFLDQQVPLKGDITKHRPVFDDDNDAFSTCTFWLLKNYLLDSQVYNQKSSFFFSIYMFSFF
jgi:hypothetical protein